MRPTCITLAILIGSSALLSAAEGTGARTALQCSSCHPAEAAALHGADMTHALQSAKDSEVLKSHAHLVFRQGRFSWTIERDGDRSWYEVTDGSQQIRVPIDWAFGLGTAGQTYVMRRNDQWYESRVSYYKQIDGLDLTVGARRVAPRDLEEAFGHQLSAAAARECFDCHGTGGVVEGAVHTEALTPGVQCVRCHEGAQEHTAGFSSAGAPKTYPPKLSKLSAEDTSNFCGQCHRTWATIATNGPHSVVNVRFQPYRLTNSRCYDTADDRIRCIACHDPHKQVVHDAAFYDARCQACHSPTGKPGARLCKVAQKDCVTCHMPKTLLPEAHNKFTDHWIRVVRPGDSYPD